MSSLRRIEGQEARSIAWGLRLVAKELRSDNDQGASGADIKTAHDEADKLYALAREIAAGVSLMDTWEGYVDVLAMAARGDRTPIFSPKDCALVARVLGIASRRLQAERGEGTNLDQLRARTRIVELNEAMARFIRGAKMMWTMKEGWAEVERERKLEERDKALADEAAASGRGRGGRLGSPALQPDNAV